jgi:hypothetical protein
LCKQGAPDNVRSALFAVESMSAVREGTGNPQDCPLIA